MRLIDLQRTMQRAITEGADPPALLGADGIAVYRHAWRARMIEALRANYPVLHRVLGDEAFAELGDAYLASHPSHRRSIRWFGDRLPAFVRQNPDLLPHPAVAEMARFEWALSLAFDGPDAEVLDVAALAALEPGQWAALRFTLHPTCQLLRLEWSVAPVWRELADAVDPNHQASRPEPLDHAVLIWRKGLQPSWRSLAPLEAGLLEGIRNGLPFEALCALAGDVVGEPDAPAAVLGFVQQWLGDGILADSTAADGQSHDDSQPAWRGSRPSTHAK
ncbi:MAG: putative DNA-binding domain-containing protein [Zoogloeaceae bacterium]|nr:putative DNA-binding domain-containing protein [Rhodocyclaceae bacterium]MCP5237455.1 putative DNA-binding domain-containing protein [Zoogloeaceae bacterium]